MPGTCQRSMMKKCLVVTLFLSLVSLFVFSYLLTSYHPSVHVRRTVPQPHFSCRPNSDLLLTDKRVNDHVNKEYQQVIENKALLMLEATYSTQGQEIIVILEANRIKY